MLIAVRRSATQVFAARPRPAMSVTQHWSSAAAAEGGAAIDATEARVVAATSARRGRHPRRRRGRLGACGDGAHPYGPTRTRKFTLSHLCGRCRSWTPNGWILTPARE